MELFIFINWAQIGSFCSTGGMRYRRLLEPLLAPDEVVPVVPGDSLSPVRRPARPICIGNDVWTREKAFVLEGGIGDGAVVTGDAETYSIVAGVPARPIGRRFDDERVRCLLELRWWEWSDREICERGGFFEAREGWCSMAVSESLDKEGEER